MKIDEIEIKSWKEYKSRVENHKSTMIYRGQVDSSWDITSKLERSKLLKKSLWIESKFLGAFKRNAHNYLSHKEIPGTELEWFAMLQHFGAPTRLIDFTYSPYVAAFFAFEKLPEDPPSHVSIWEVDREDIFFGSHQKLIELFEDITDMDSVDSNYYPTVDTILSSPKYDVLLHADVHKKSLRIYSQQGTFLFSGSSKTFMDLVKDLWSEHRGITKVNIPIYNRPDVLRDLLKMNVNRATLFPGIDGFVANLEISEVFGLNSDETTELMFMSNLFGTPREK